ncbi:MAG: nitroreductase family protein [Synergistaceae bacterium]|nr:nitroreductase family protein [Synergistaceae bacterium]
MDRSFREALKNRRSFYDIENRSPVSDALIEEIIDFALEHMPSAFNSQTTRLVLLLGEHHKKLWNIVMETLREMIPADKFAATEKKVGSFAAGYGTILFFEDQNIVKDLQGRFPTYADNFPVWAQHASAMHQFAIWTMLEDEEGLGASLQHYNPIIDAKVREAWSLEPDWLLVAQMPFGSAGKRPDPKETQPVDARKKVFK